MTGYWPGQVPRAVFFFRLFGTHCFHSPEHFIWEPLNPNIQVMIGPVVVPLELNRGNESTDRWNEVFGSSPPDQSLGPTAEEHQFLTI